MDSEKIGAFIRELRKEKGLTQEQLAEKLGVSQRSVSRWETGKTLPDYALLPALCEALDVNAAELLGAKRIEGERVEKEEVTALTRRVIAMAQNKKRLYALIGAAVSALAAVLCALGLYTMEFHVAADSTDTLEAAIDAYRFNDEDAARVFKRKAVGRRLYVLYGNKSRPGTCGLVTMERGVFGKYRFLSSVSSDERWICAAAETVGGRQYCITYGVNDLPGLEAYAVCGMIYRGGESFPTDPPGPAFREEYTGSPFLSVREVDRDLVLWTARLRYYAQGRELSLTDMEERYGPRQLEATATSYGTMEAGLVYVYMGIVLLLGVILVRYFLTEKPHRKAQGLPE